jgi:putative transposase
MRKANGTGGCYGRGLSRLSKFIAFQVGLQIPCGVYTQKRRKALFGQARRYLGEIFHALARRKECQILEGHLMADHVHRCIAIPPRYPVASVIGFLKGKSAIAIAREVCGEERNFTGEHLWARGYAVSTVGFELEQVRQYIRDQEEADGTGGEF